MAERSGRPRAPRGSRAPLRRRPSRGRTGRAPWRSARRRGVEAAQRLQHLHLLVAHGAAVVGDGRLHRHQREELHHVVLHHVPQRAGVVVVAAAAADADALGHGDLHVVDVAAVPDAARGCRWRSGRPGCSGRSPCPGSGRCGRRRPRGRRSGCTRFSSRAVSRSCAERLLDDHARPALAGRLRAAVRPALELLDDEREGRWAGPPGRRGGCRSVPRSWCRRSSVSFKPLVCFRVVVVAGDVEQACAKLSQTSGSSGRREYCWTAFCASSRNSSSVQLVRAKPTTAKRGGSRRSSARL